MNGLWDFQNPRRRVGKIVLIVTSVVALVVIAAVATGCGSAKKSSSTAAKKSSSTASNAVTGRHGTSIAFLKVLPRNQTLQQGVTATIVLKSNLAFVVGVQNDGDQPEQNVKVKLVIHQKAPAKPIVKEAEIGRIFPGTTMKVFLKGPFNPITLVTMVPIDVMVNPVPGEASTANNLATYKARFSLG
jgi:hypothetical protein